MLRSRKILGIDPGKQGALALLDGQGNFIDMKDMPIIKVGKRVEVDPVGITAIIDAWGPTFAVVEQQGPRRGSGGGVATFSLGRNYGSLTAALSIAKVAWVAVTPLTWKKRMGVTKEKATSEAAVRRRFPQVKCKRHDHAEALLIAEYGRLYG